MKNRKINKYVLSDELLARYLDGKANDEEKKQVLSYLQAHEEEFDDILKISQEVAYQYAIEDQTSNNSIYSRSLLDKTQLDDDVRYQIAGHGKMAIAADESCGEKTCAIQAQQIVLQDYGINVSTSELTSVAQHNGWFIDKQGTPLDFVGELLNYYDVQAVQMRNANIYNLTHELSQGHRVIVGVDVHDLEQTSIWREYDEVMTGKEADHVLVVAGIDTSDPQDLKVVLTDPTRPDSRKEFSSPQFMEAWKDSGYFMVATQKPAPLELNPEMQNFDYDRGFVERFANVAYSEIVKRLDENGYILGGKNNCGFKQLLCAIIIFMSVAAAAVVAWRFFTPIDMTILISDDKDYTIPNLPFETGNLTIQYGDQMPQSFAVTSQSRIILLRGISYKLKNKKAHIQLVSEGYQQIDTMIPIAKSIELFIKRDNSLSTIFGSIIDATTGNPIPGAIIKVHNMSTQSDVNGNYSIEIPFSRQAKTQRVYISKTGYAMWIGTYEPSLTESWDIALENEIVK